MSRLSPGSSLALSTVLALVTGCGDRSPADASRVPDGQSTPDPSDVLYDPSRLHQIDIEMEPASWAVLREQGFSLFQFQRGEAGNYDYTYFDAKVMIDGQTVDRVAVRKKGGLGSLSRLRPSLILDLNRNVDDQRIYGMSRLTLNNNRGDDSFSRQCMAFELFRRAGLPASRCSLAHLTVNHQDLGTYSNVEPIRKPFLERHFGDSSGNLYEGRESGDFTLATVDVLEMKTNESTNDRSDLRNVAHALEADDEHVVQELGRFVDLDQFRTFWAMETLTGNWDTYSGNTNNFYVYHDPGDDRFHFLPWGPDAAFTGGSVVDSYNQTLTVYATGALSNRLYNLPAERSRFRSLLADLNDRLWDPPALLARVDALTSLIADDWPGAVSKLREYIGTYSNRLRTELALPAPEWKLGGIDLKDACSGTMGEGSGTFDATWSTEPSPTPGKGVFNAEVAIAGNRFPTVTWVGTVGRDPLGGSASSSVQLVGTLADGRSVVLVLVMPPGTIATGSQPFYNFETIGYVLLVTTEGRYQMLGFMNDGSVDFEQAGENVGDTVKGSFRGSIYQTGCADLPVAAGN